MDFPTTQRDLEEALELLRVYEHSESAHDLLPYAVEMRHLQALRDAAGAALELTAVEYGRKEQGT